MNIRLKNLSNLSTLNLSNKYAEIPSLYINNCPSISNWDLLKSIYNTQGNTLKYINLDLGSVTGTEADIDMLYAFIQKTGGVNNYGRVTRSDAGVYSDDISQFPALTGTLTVAKAHSPYEAKAAAIQQALGMTVTVGGYYVDFFGDTVAEQLAATAWGDGVGVTAAEAAAVTTIGTTFKASAITDLRWIKWFTSITAIPDNSFRNCTQLGNCGDIDWPGSLESLGYGAFEGCSNFNFVSLPSSLVSIGEEAFRYCDALTIIYIPAGVDTLKGFSFNDCDGLTALTIMNQNFLSFEIWSLGACRSLRELKLLCSTPPALNISAFNSNPLQHIYVPAESVEAYKAASGWSAFASIIEAIPSES